MECCCGHAFRREDVSVPLLPRYQYAGVTNADNMRIAPMRVLADFSSFIGKQTDLVYGLA